MSNFLRFGFILYLCFSMGKGVAQVGTQFREISYKDALKQSKELHKPIFYMIFATWCPHCHKMREEVFTDTALANYLNANFICVIQDGEIGEGPTLRKKFNVSAFPGLLFIDENETLLYTLNGEFKTDDMLNEAKNALTPEKQLPFLKAAFEADPSNADKCLAYLITLRKGSDRKTLSPAAHAYLATQTEAQLPSAINWRIIANAVTDIKSREFQYVLAHQDQFAAVASKVRVQRKIGNIVSELLEPYVGKNDSVGYKTQREMVKSMQVQKADSLVFSYDIMLAERTGNWQAYRKAARDGVEKYIWTDQKTIKEIAQNYLLHCPDPESLKSAIKWTKHALEVMDSYDGNIILAKLYIKTNDRKQAVVHARAAMELTKSLGWNSKDADALFKELNIN
ncbi:DUF255 domain-containing protein [Flavobacterium sp.]|uniref:thioredoxin family protein n=1 Tax=Flavobacterium sp. TaxID=239 RepID=UPI0026217A72|nr:DUF255 domain-containing protein [Flavobacterium sp.]